MRLTQKNIYFFWLTTRLWVILSGYHYIPYPQSEFLFSDVRLYDWWAGNILDGHFPINDPMWQYPPLAAVIFAVGYSLAHETVGFVALALIADFSLFSLLRGKGISENNLLPAKLWIVAPLAMGPIFLGRFDVFPTLTTCIALLYMSRPGISGAWLTLGTLLKVWPVLGLLAVPRPLFRRTMVNFIAASITLLLVLQLWWNDSLNFIQGQKSRGLQIESLGALPYMWWNAGAGTVTTNFQFGAIEVIAHGTALVSAVISLIFVAFLIYIISKKMTGAIDDVAPAHIMLLIVLMSMLTSRVLSPQYNLWILGLLAVVAFNPMKQFTAIAALILATSFCGQLLYPWLYVGFQQGDVFATVIHTVRIICLIAATALTWIAVFRAPPHQGRDHQATLADD